MSVRLSCSRLCSLCTPECTPSPRAGRLSRSGSPPRWLRTFSERRERLNHASEAENLNRRLSGGQSPGDDRLPLDELLRRVEHRFPVRGVGDQDSVVVSDDDVGGLDDRPVDLDRDVQVARRVLGCLARVIAIS